MQKGCWLWSVAALISSSLICTQAVAFEGKHWDIDWAKELQLSDAQQNRIDAIEQRHREERKALRSEREVSCEQLQAERRQQYDRMRAEIQQVLTDEQKARATAQMREQHRQMQWQHARDVAHRLQLSAEQRELLFRAVGQLNDDYEWPLDLVQHEEARGHLDAAIRQVLTGQQADNWDRMREQQVRKWHHHEEGRNGECRPEMKADSLMASPE